MIADILALHVYLDKCGIMLAGLKVVRLAMLTQQYFIHGSGSGNVHCTSSIVHGPGCTIAVIKHNPHMNIHMTYTNNLQTKPNTYVYVK